MELSMRNIVLAGMALAIAAFAGTGCAQAVPQAQQAQARIVALCGAAVPLTGFDPAIGVYVAAACATEEAIAKVALSPTGVAWLTRLYDELRTAAGKG
jgi:hypothetical protein